MTDRELEEAAAQAAGYEYRWVEPMKGLGLWWIKDAKAKYGERPWTPLRNNADAFGLMCAVRVELYFGATKVEVRGTPEEYPGEPYGDDREAAARRAIVRAVAEQAANIGC